MLKIGIIGCGYWGKNYVRIFNEITDSKVVEVVDKVRANLDAIKSGHPLINISTDYHSTLDNPSIEAVVIATTASTHFTIAQDAIAKGKHLIIEKPLALTPEDCKKLTEMADKAGVILMVGHTFLYNDSVRKMKALIREEKSGGIYYLMSRRNHLGLIREDVSALWDLGAHDISIFSYLLDENPTSISAIGGCYLREEREDVCFLTLYYPNKVIGHIQVSWVDANKVREVIAITGKRRIVFDDINNLESIRVFEKGISLDQGVETFGEFQYLLRDGNIFSPKVERKEPLKNLCQNFIECVKENKKPLTDGVNGSMVVQVLNAASESMAQRGKEIIL